MDLYQYVPAYYGKGRYKRAYSLVLDALADDGENVHLLIWASELARIQHLHRDQIFYMETYLGLTGHNPYWQADLGKAYLEMGQWAKAINYLKKSVKEIPNDADLLKLEAWCWFNLKKYEEAIEICNLGLAMEPLCIETTWIRAMANFNLLRMKAAAEDFAQVKKGMKNNARFFGHVPIFPMALWN